MDYNPYDPVRDQDDDRSLDRARQCVVAVVRISVMSGTWNGFLIESILCHGSRLSQLGEFFVHKLNNPEKTKNGLTASVFMLIT